MTEYRKNSEDQISSMCHELTSSDISDRYARDRTLKSYIHDISKKINDYLFYQEKLQSSERYSISWALGILSFVSIFLLTYGFQSNPDIDWLRDNQIYLKFWGVALAAIYIGSSLERSSLIKSIWGFATAKIIVSLAFSGVAVYSAGKAAEIINDIFGVDAAAFPMTFTFTTAIIVFHIIAPFLFFVSLGAILHLFNAIEWIRSKWKGETYDLPPYHSFVFPILASVLMYNGWAWSSNQLGEKLLPGKVYVMAHTLDFNSNHECSRLKKGVPVVFLGPAQNSILADAYKVKDMDFGDFFNAKIDVPKQFYRMKCTYPNYDE
ncbi:hypothetical protein [Marinobacterium stanieri]|uniref:hypothetical protein n=1 Tax=Marinobacterium stanieri TaxID=49186 RepID=UPI0002E49AB3|nr:hypothetical protein [Marinobacterium stanieri]